MTNPIFDFPILAFCWYGIVSVISLLCFASLSYEVQRGSAACKEAEDEEAWRVTWTTYHVNFGAMVAANIVFVVTLVGTCAAENEWRPYVAASILACGCYWSYTRSCEKRLIRFLKAVGVYRH